MGSHEILHNVDQMESLVEAFQEYNSACSPLKEGLVEAKRGCKVSLIFFFKYSLYLHNRFNFYQIVNIKWLWMKASKSESLCLLNSSSLTRGH